MGNWDLLTALGSPLYFCSCATRNCKLASNIHLLMDVIVCDKRIAPMSLGKLSIIFEETFHRSSYSFNRGFWSLKFGRVQGMAEKVSSEASYGRRS
jgi:hypothetical protein